MICILKMIHYFWSGGKNARTTSSPGTSTNVGISPQDFLTLV